MSVPESKSPSPPAWRPAVMWQPDQRWWQWLSGRMVVAQVLALLLITALAALSALAGVPKIFWALVGAMVACWAAVGAFVLVPLIRLAAGGGAEASSDAQAARMAIEDARKTQQRLTREVHHRVKNNLQVISSLISIQARESDQRNVARAYAAIQMRVGALALVHRWLFEDVGRGVDLGALTHDLCAVLQQGVAATEGVELAIATRIERLYVSQDAAVPIAFIMTEIVAAAAGKATRGPADITITLAQLAGEGRLTIASPVFASDLFAPGTTSAPARIVHGMIRQLRGLLTHAADDVAYVVTFPLPLA